MVDYKLDELFKKDSVEKKITISYDNTTITNEDLLSEEMTLEESLCSEQQLRFGSCESSMINFKVANIFSPMIGKELDVKTVLDAHAESPFRYGFYKVKSDKPTADREWREVVAYDSMYDIINSNVIDWYNTILPNEDSTVTMREFRRSFVAYFGLSEAPATLVNDDMVIRKTIGVKKSEESQDKSVISENVVLSGKDVATAICEINGCFGHIGRDGRFCYIYLDNIIRGLYPSDNLYPENDIYPSEPNTYPISKTMYTSCTYEDYECKGIEKLQIRQEENDIGVVIGEGENSYIIENNFLVYGKTSEELQGIGNNLFQKIKGVSYRPFNMECVGNPCLEVGDAVRVPTTYQIVESYILKRTLKGIQALKDSYSSSGEEKYNEPVNSVQKSIVAIKGKTNKLERTVEETKSTIADVENGLQSQIRQTADSISAEVSRATSAEGILSSRIQITADGISSKVSKGDVVSEINQSADTITLTSGRLVITTGNLTLDSAGNVSMTGNINAISGKVGMFNITNGRLEWMNQGTVISGSGLETSVVSALPNVDGITFGSNNKETIIDGSTVYCIRDMRFDFDHYIRTSSDTSIIGWSSYGNLHIGDYNRSVLPSSLILNSKKVQMVNASGSLVDINSNTSDEREKNILSRIEQKKAVEFIKNLVPIAYQYKAESNPDTHWGFGAQTTLAAMEDSGMGESRLIERNPYVPGAPINPDDETTFFYSMKPDEFAAPFAAAFQYLFDAVEKIEGKIGGI